MSKDEIIESFAKFLEEVEKFAEVVDVIESLSEDERLIFNSDKRINDLKKRLLTAILSYI